MELLDVFISQHDGREGLTLARSSAVTSLPSLLILGVALPVLQGCWWPQMEDRHCHLLLWGSAVACPKSKSPLGLSTVGTAVSPPQVWTPPGVLVNPSLSMPRTVGLWGSQACSSGTAVPFP